MDLKEKVEKALQRHFQVEHLDLRDDNGIIGVMVSPDFEGVGRLDRQRRIDRVLRNRSMKLTRREQRQVLLIAAFTPTEYGPIGPEEDEDDSGDAHAENGARECFPDLLPKVERALRSHFRIDHLELVDDDGIFGSMVSPDFKGVSIADRGALLDRVFRDPASGLSVRELRQIRLIMTRTPVEYQAKLELDSLG
jgi:acid stress-induced BolA-like protein IbaG/YrbA